MDSSWFSFGNWQTFLPTLIATFLGVFLSFSLFRWWKQKQNRALASKAKQAILEELHENKKLLEHLCNMLEGAKRKSAVQYNIPHRLKTRACDNAFRRNQVRFLGDVKLQDEIAYYTQQGQFLNERMRVYEEFVSHNFAAIFREEGHIPRYQEREWARIQGEDIKKEAAETMRQVNNLIDRLKGLTP